MGGKINTKYLQNCGYKLVCPGRVAAEYTRKDSQDEKVPQHMLSTDHTWRQLAPSVALCRACKCGGPEVAVSEGQCFWGEGSKEKRGGDIWIHGCEMEKEGKILRCHRNKREV